MGSAPATVTLPATVTPAAPAIAVPAIAFPAIAVREISGAPAAGPAASSRAAGIPLCSAAGPGPATPPTGPTDPATVAAAALRNCSRRDSCPDLRSEEHTPELQS